MFGIDKISLNFSFSSILFFAGILLITAYSVYTYLYTVPAVSTRKKILLVLLRASALMLLLFIIFEPVLTLQKKETFQPVNLIFIDNSRSITIDDKTSREEKVKSFLLDFRNSGLSDQSELYTFGNSVRRTEADSINLLFSEGNTDFSEIFSAVEESNVNIASVTIVSDGVITEGQNPVYKAAKMNIPVFTLGIGDSSRKNDISIRDIIFNEYIYSGTATVISASIIHTGYEGQTVSVSLYENGKAINSQNIVLSGDGFQDIKFEYKPESPGEKKMMVSISGQKGEQSFENNKKIFFLNVLSSKIKVVILAGAPSPDVSFIRNSLLRDKNLSVNSVVQIAPSKFIEDINRDRAIDSAQILFLVGFPSANSENNLWEKIVNKITREKKPFFILLSDGTDLNKLRRIQNELPFNINKINNGVSEVLADVNPSKSRHPMLQTGNNNSFGWSNLPPVYMNNSDFSAKPESEVLANVKIRNVPVKKPLIITRKLGSSKSTAVLAKDIWRWKLQTATKGSELYDSFMMNTVKWLNVKDDQKQVVIRTSKKFYSLGEEVPFSAQVYDASFNPVPDANVKINISSKDEKINLELNPIGNGIYDGVFETNKTGDYSFTGEAVLEETKLGNDKGTFNIGEVDVEMLNPRMDYEFLSLLAAETGGKFYLPGEQKQLFDMLRQIRNRTSDVKTITSEISLWSNEWLLIFVILFFALEWFIRKQSGML